MKPLRYCVQGFDKSASEDGLADFSAGTAAATRVALAKVTVRPVPRCAVCALKLCCLVMLLSVTTGSVAQTTVHSTDTVYASDWTLQWDTVSAYQYGANVELQENLLMVGNVTAKNAYQTTTDPVTYYQGASYVYQLERDRWVERWRLTPEEPICCHLFGHDQSISGSYFFVIAEGSPGPSRTTGAYIYERVDNELVRRARLTRDDGGRYALLGVSGERAVMSGYLDTFVDVVTGQTENWVHEARLDVPGGVAVLAFESDRVIAGHDSLVTFIRDNTASWQKVQTAIDRHPNDIDTSGDRLIIGDASALDFKGLADIFVWNGTGWELEAELLKELSFEPYPEMWFGWAVAIDGQFALASRPHEGVVHLFERTGSTWAHATEIEIPCGVADVGLSGTHIAIAGMTCNEDPSQNLVYMFEIDTATGIDTAAPPRDFRLYSNYPNPFNPTTTISYALSRAADVTLTVHDVLGRRVGPLVAGSKPPGTYEVSFDAAGLPSGVYFYRLEAEDHVETKQMVVLR